MKPLSIELYDSYLKTTAVLNPEETVEPGKIKLYSCGPTVYNYQSIGNMRAVWLPDTLIKVAKLAGWETEWVLNITDVGHLVGDGDEGEDKIEKSAKSGGQTAEDVVNFYLDDYKRQCKALNLDLPEGKMNPKATEYIKEQMILSLELLCQGKAYVADDGIYFDSEVNKDLLDDPRLERFKAEGDCDYTGRDIKGCGIKNPGDFALWRFVEEKSLQKWKFAEVEGVGELFNEVLECHSEQKNGHPELVSGSLGTERNDGIATSDPSVLQTSPLTEGRKPCNDRVCLSDKECDLLKNSWGSPGWHSECVCMICGVLGQEVLKTKDKFNFEAFSAKPVIDVHTGGEDHIDIHHKNEILQSEALGFNLSKYWAHNRFVMVDGGKMSKSLGNVYLVTGKKEETGFDSIEEKGFDPLAYRLMLFEHRYTERLNFTWEKLEQSQARLFNLRKEAAKLNSVCHSEQSEESLIRQNQNLLNILTDNLNTPKFLEEYQNLLVNCHFDRSGEIPFETSQQISLLKYLDQELLQLDLFPEIPEEVVNLAEQRKQAKENKDYQKSDEIRDQITELGYQIDDYAWGYGIWKKPV